ncbi:hypothetical protein [Streptomyces sp. URMC 123]|uniref:hypothetical protein n=1 Tax=Streptomyces sp. URMC 123 TaxID=3423403 RepID=UPI003F1D98DB
MEQQGSVIDSMVENNKQRVDMTSGEVIKSAQVVWRPTLPAHDHSVAGARFHWE